MRVRPSHLLALLVLPLLGSCNRTHEVKIGGRSMEPALKDGDVLSWEEIPLTTPLKRGQIVVIESPEHNDSRWVRRVVGLPGERIDIRVGGVQADGKLYTWDELTEHSAVTGAVESGPYRVPSDGYFLIGDNMGNSRDSREFGGSLRKEILGVKK